MRSSKTRETIICTLEAQANLSSQDSGIMKPLFKIHRPAHGNVPLMDIEIFVLKTPPTFFYFEFSLTYQGSPHLCWKKTLQFPLTPWKQTKGTFLTSEKLEWESSRRWKAAHTGGSYCFYIYKGTSYHWDFF